MMQNFTWQLIHISMLNKLKKVLIKKRIKIITLLIDLHDKLFLYPNLRKIYKEICPFPEFIIDIGANKGQSIDFFLSLNTNCEVIAFEPIPHLYNVLVNKYAHCKNVKIYKSGISNYNGAKVFYENKLTSTSSFEKINYLSNCTTQKASLLGIQAKDLIVNSYEVNVITLGDFLQSRNITKPIDIVKIDTEGHEYKCLLGLFNETFNPPPIKCLQIENHSSDQYINHTTIKQIKTLLSQQGFSTYNKLTYLFGNFNEYIFY